MPAGDLAGHGPTLAPRRLADVTARRRGPPRDLGRRLRAATARRPPQAAPDLGDQRPPGRTDQAQSPSGAIECRWPGSPRAGPSHRALGGYYGDSSRNTTAFSSGPTSFPVLAFGLARSG